MKKARLSPREKKNHEYERDTRVVAEYPKAYRVSKPRKKKVANQRGRRRMDRLMDRAIREERPEEITVPSLQSKPRLTIQNLAVPLGKFIENQKLHRETRAFRKVRKRREK